MTTHTTTRTDTTANAALARQFVEEFWNNGDELAADRLLAPEYVDHAYQTNGRAGLLATLAQLKASFSDHRQMVEAQIAQNDLVVLRMRFQATHTGDFRGTPPSGNQVDVAVYRTYRIAEGRITEHWALLDTASLLRQIGAKG